MQVSAVCCSYYNQSELAPPQLLQSEMRRVVLCRVCTAKPPDFGDVLKT